MLYKDNFCAMGTLVSVYLQRLAYNFDYQGVNNYKLSISLLEFLKFLYGLVANSTAQILIQICTETKVFRAIMPCSEVPNL